MRIRLSEHKPGDYRVALRDNNVWADHRLRARITAEMIAWLEPTNVVDPACGDGAIVLAAHAIRPIQYAVLGDVSKANIAAIDRPHEWTSMVAPATQTLNLMADNMADVIVLTEFLEHIEDPVEMLRLAARKGRNLVASSPLFEASNWTTRTVGEQEISTADYRHDDNPEHLWQFDHYGFGDMLEEAGWAPTAFVPLYFPTVYDFQLWVAERA